MKQLILIIALILSSKASCQNADGYYNMASDKFSLGDLPGAITLLDKAIELEKIPMNMRSNYFQRARIKLATEDYVGAISDFSKAEALGNRNDLLYLDRAKAKIELKDYRGALKDYDTYIMYNPYIIDPNSEYQNGGKSSRIYVLKGNAKFNLNDLKGAKADYDIAISIDPKNANAFYKRGLVKVNLYQKSSACLDFSKSGELGMAEAYDAIKQYCN